VNFFRNAGISVRLLDPRRQKGKKKQAPTKTDRKERGTEEKASVQRGGRIQSFAATKGEDLNKEKKTGNVLISTREGAKKNKFQKEKDFFGGWKQRVGAHEKKGLPRPRSKPDPSIVNLPVTNKVGGKQPLARRKGQ